MAPAYSPDRVRGLVARGLRAWREPGAEDESGDEDEDANEYDGEDEDERSNRASGCVLLEVAMPVSEGGERTIGRFAVREVLGRGASGEVYLAFDPVLRREVALKVLRDAGDAESEQRFAREAAVAAGLRHPNIIRIFEVGEAQGRRYLAMERIDGETMADHLDRCGRRRAVEILQRVAGAVGAAHAAGIVHRDLKPGNVLVDREGEPRVTDFGLASREEGLARLTRTGTVMGTPAYMAPEQVAGLASEVGPEIDVWALGTILYEILCRRLPFEGSTFPEIRRAILEDEPARPRSVVPDAPAELEAICLKCLAKGRRDRYPDAGALARELERWLEGDVVTARLPSRLGETRRRLRRRRLPLPAALGIAGIAAVVAGAVATISLRSPGEDAAGPTPEANGDEGRARRALDLWGRIATLLSDAETYTRAGDVERARARLDEGIRICREELAREDLPHGRYFLARCQIERGRRVEARLELDRALALDPGLGEARILRGRLLVDAFEQRRSRVDYSVRRGATSHGRIPLAELERADPELARLREAAASDLSATAGRSSFFREADAKVALADLARLREDLDRARDLLEEVLAEEPIHVRARLALAYLAAWENDVSGVLEETTEAIRVSAGAAEAYALRGSVRSAIARSKQGRPRAGEVMEKSLDDLERAVALGEDSAEVHALLGEVRYRLARAPGRDFERECASAIESLDRAIELEPASPAFLGNRAMVRRELGLAHANAGGDPRPDYALALADSMRAVELAPNLAAARDGLGVVRQYLGEAEAARGGDGRPRYRTALEDHLEASALEPSYALGEINAAHACRRMGAAELAAGGDPWTWYERGLEHVETAARRDPGEPDVYNAGCLLAQEWGGAEAGAGRDPRARLAAAVAFGNQALQLEPDRLVARLHRANANAALGNWLLGQGGDPRAAFARALGDFDVYLEAMPADPLGLFNRGSARFGLAQAQDRLGLESTATYRAAETDLGRLLEASPNDAQAHFLRGHIRRRLGDEQGATEDWDRAVELDPALARRLESWRGR